MSQLDYKEIKKRLPDVRFVNATDLLGQWKVVRSSYEIERIRRACQNDLPPLTAPLVKLESTEQLFREQVICNLEHYEALSDCIPYAILQ